VETAAARSNGATGFLPHCVQVLRGVDVLEKALEQVRACMGHTLVYESAGWPGFVTCACLLWRTLIRTRRMLVTLRRGARPWSLAADHPYTSPPTLVAAPQAQQCMAAPQPAALARLQCRVAENLAHTFRTSWQIAPRLANVCCVCMLFSVTLLQCSLPPVSCPLVVSPVCDAALVCAKRRQCAGPVLAVAPLPHWLRLLHAPAPSHRCMR